MLGTVPSAYRLKNRWDSVNQDFSQVSPLENVLKLASKASQV